MKKILCVGTVFAFFALAIVGCKPSVKGELDSWENNKKDLTEAVTNYPSFKDVLNKKMADAQKMWDEALKVVKEDEKAKKMKEANSFLNDLVNLFSQIKYKKKGIEDAISKINSKKLAGAEDRIRSNAVDEANKALKEIEKIMAEAKIQTEDEAKSMAKDVISKLIGAQGAIDRAIKSVEPKSASTFKKKK